MIKTTLFAILSLTTVGYGMESDEEYAARMARERAQQVVQYGAPRAGVSAAPPAARPGPMAALQNLQQMMDQFQGDPRLALPDPLPRGPVEPRALDYLPPAVGQDDLGTVRAPGYMAPTQQDLANRAFVNSAALVDVDAMGALFDQGVAVTPDQATVDGVFTNLLTAGNYEFIRRILGTQVRPSNAVAKHILDVAMAYNYTDLAADVFHILVPTPGATDHHGDIIAFLQAARDGDVAIVKAYLQQAISGVQVNQWNILFAFAGAAIGGRRDVALALLDPAINPIQPDQERVNGALLLARMHDKYDLVVALLNPSMNRGRLPNREGVLAALSDGGTPEIRAVLQNALTRMDAAGAAGAAGGAAGAGY